MQFKVITAVTVEPITLAEARLQAQLTADDTTAEDSLIEAWITAAREVAEAYTGRALAHQTLEAALNSFPESRGSIDLPRPPVTEITSVNYVDLNGADQTLDAAAYSLSPYGESRSVSLAYGATWPITRDIQDAVWIRFTAGYAGNTEPKTPKAVKAALLLMVAWLFEHRGDEMSSNDIQPPAAKALLDTVKVWGW